jgi:uncharacterized protein (TIGR02147 family)
MSHLGGSSSGYNGDVMAGTTTSVSVFQFLDAREFLRQAYLAERKRSRAFSQRYITKAMGEKSSSFFQDVLSGKSKLTPARALGFARLFKLSKAEAAYFENVVLYTQAATDAERKHALEKLTASGPAGGHTLLEAFHTEYFSKWYYAAVRELLAIHDFRGNHEELARLLNPPIFAEEARQALALLLKLKLIQKTAHGGYQRTDRTVLSGPKIGPVKMRSALLANLDLARRALDEFPAEKRPFSYQTLSVSEKSLQKIRGLITEFRDAVFDAVIRDESVDRLYQLNLQLFPLSDAVKRRKK